MKKILYKLLLFLTLPAVCLCLVFFLTDAIPKDAYVLPQGVNCVFVGDSHTYFAIKPASQYANYSYNSQAIMYSYQIVKKLLATNTSNPLQCVVVGLAAHNAIDISNRFTEDNAARYFHLFSTKEKIKWIKEGRITNYLNFARALILQRFHENPYAYNSQKYQQPTLGQKKSEQYASIKKRIRFQYFDSEVIRKITTRDSIYYRKLKKLLRSKNIRLVCISTPTFAGYKAQIPKYLQANLSRFIEKNQLPFMNLSSYKGLELDPDNFIQDGDHLSSKGAALFTNYLIHDCLFD